MKARLLVIGAVAAVTVLGLGACGGGGDSGAEDGITEAIEKVMTTSDPKNCTESETLRFAEQNNQVEGQAAVEACEKEAEAGEEVAKSANVSNVSVDNTKATAQVRLEGGSLGMQAIEIGLAEEGGRWKLDQIEGFAEYDGKALGEAFERRFSAEPKGLTPEQAKCIADKLAEASQSEAEELFFSGSAKKIVELAKGCA